MSSSVTPRSWVVGSFARAYREDLDHETEDYITGDFGWLVRSNMQHAARRTTLTVDKSALFFVC